MDSILHLEKKNPKKEVLPDSKWKVQPSKDGKGFKDMIEERLLKLTKGVWQGFKSCYFEVRNEF